MATTAAADDGGGGAAAARCQINFAKVTIFGQLIFTERSNFVDVIG